MSKVTLAVLVIAIQCVTANADFLSIKGGKKYQCGTWGCAQLFINPAGQFYFRAANKNYFASPNVAKNVLAQPDYQGAQISQSKNVARNFYSSREIAQRQVFQATRPATQTATATHSTTRQSRPVYDPQAWYVEQNRLEREVNAKLGLAKQFHFESISKEYTDERKRIIEVVNELANEGYHLKDQALVGLRIIDIEKNRPPYGELEVRFHNLERVLNIPKGTTYEELLPFFVED